MNLYRFFKTTITTTFILEVFCTFFLLIYFIFLAILINLNLLIFEMETLFTLIALGASCLITLLGIGFFMRLRNKLLDYLGSEEEFPVKTSAQMAVLIIWILAILFFGAAVYYSLFLIFQWYIYPVYAQTLPIFFIFIILGIIIICFILQLFLVIMAKFTRTIVKEVLDED